ncbi:GIY-YIG nuclease family protein [Pseudolysinimonas sp.]|jgi:putative endonuclease|uniref:GIY-YIG nuclease family protein n=1 Tax=Pseudolysinimonas sp. TaxID=2680009 RepID=UPI00378420CE
MPACDILRCADESFYVGSTRDLVTRLEQHVSGMGSAYTAKRLPVELVWSAEFDRIDDAYFMEKRIQGWSRRKREPSSAEISTRCRISVANVGRAVGCLSDRRGFRYASGCAGRYSTRGSR